MTADFVDGNTGFSWWIGMPGEEIKRVQRWAAGLKFLAYSGQANLKILSNWPAPRQAQSVQGEPPRFPMSDAQNAQNVPAVPASADCGFSTR